MFEDRLVATTTQSGWEMSHIWMADWSLSSEGGGRYEGYSRPRNENVCRRDYCHSTTLCQFGFAALHIPPPLASQHTDNWLNKSPRSGLSAKLSKTNPSFVLQNWGKTVLRSGSDADVIRPETVRKTEPEVQRGVKVRPAQVHVS